MNCELSIVVPVYNVAPFLGHCLQSVAEQELVSYEVILVNDASYDNSRAIAEDWCRSHPQFRLINHEKNRGLSEARNTGLDEAQGRWVTFVDSDDFLSPATLSQALGRAEGADVVEYPVRAGHLSKHPVLWQPRETDLSFTEWMQGDGFAHCYAWNKLYRRSLWDGIRFPAGRLYEDILTIPYILQKANTIRQIPDGLYYYCQRDGSISNSLDANKLREYTKALVELLKMPVNVRNTALYIAARNAQITYRRHGGIEHLVPLQTIPWKYILSPRLTPRQRLKALGLKFHLL